MAKEANKKSTDKVGVFKRIARFFKEIKSEFKKIVWPTKKQLFNNTLVVLCFSGIVAAIISLFDLCFRSLISLI